MYLLATLKKTFEMMTGAGRPSHTSLEASVAPRTPHTTMFRDDGIIPNNPKLPFIHYLGAVALPERGDPAAVFEELFERNQIIRAMNGRVERVDAVVADLDIRHLEVCFAS